jgi:preprotein translocase subunit SecE
MKGAAPKRRKGIIGYAKGIITELKKVTWPTKSEALRLSVIVLIICIVVGAILGALDYGFTQLVDKIFIGGT